MTSRSCSLYANVAITAGASNPKNRNKKMPVARRISHTTQLSSKIYVKLERQIASSTLSTRIKQCNFLQFTGLNCAVYLLFLGMEIYLHELFSSWLQFSWIRALYRQLAHFIFWYASHPRHFGCCSWSLRLPTSHNPSSYCCTHPQESSLLR